MTIFFFFKMNTNIKKTLSNFFFLRNTQSGSSSTFGQKISEFTDKSIYNIFKIISKTYKDFS